MSAAAESDAEVRVADRSAAALRRAPLTTGVDYWSTPASPADGVRALRLADGPHGLRVQNDDAPDHLGIGRSLPATCFPPAVTLASSWDPELITDVGRALGEEAAAQGVDVVLGPGLNIKRSPLCGRNFEYYSEDPLLAGILAGAMVAGIQSQGVAACLKHFAVNNQETDRQRVSAEVDRRTLFEIYLRAFQIALETEPAWAIMSSYNRINGVYASENPFLLTDTLRGRWGWDGVVVSDWGAVHDPVVAVASGLDLRMPGRPDDARVAAAAKSGSLAPEVLETVAERLALLGRRTTRAEAVADPAAPDAHHDLARRAAARSAVLLTNDGVLPLRDLGGVRVAVVGSLAREPRYQGAGSSAVNPTRVVSAWDSLHARLTERGAVVTFAPGYAVDAAAVDAVEEDRAFALAADADVVIACVGLPGSAEAEGRDRTSIELPEAQRSLLARLGRSGVPVVACLSNGSAVSTASWREGMAAIVEFWLTGQAHGDSIVDVLLGDVNPAGRLAETVPQRLQDTPSYLSFPGEAGHVRYGEGVFVGYRHYDALGIAVDFPFGHGLSYTSFAYDELEIEPSPDPSSEVALTVSARITNTGACAGDEVVQLYIAEDSAVVRMPEQQLRAFSRVHLAAGESRRVSFAVARDRLGYFDVRSDAWEFEGGILEVRVGASSRDIRLRGTAEMAGRAVSVPLTLWSSFGEWLADARRGPRLTEAIAERGGITGRMADLLADEAGRDSVLSVPMASLTEFPGFPFDADEIVAMSDEE